MAGKKICMVCESSWGVFFLGEGRQVSGRVLITGRGF